MSSHTTANGPQAIVDLSSSRECSSISHTVRTCHGIIERGIARLMRQEQEHAKQRKEFSAAAAASIRRLNTPTATREKKAYTFAERRAAIKAACDAVERNEIGTTEAAQVYLLSNYTVKTKLLRRKRIRAGEPVEAEEIAHLKRKLHPIFARGVLPTAKTLLAKYDANTLRRIYTGYKISLGAESK